MPRRNYENLQLSEPKFRCFFGYFHFQTATIIICSLVLIYSFFKTISLISNLEFDSWEFIKIIYFFLAAIGPLIGIKKKKLTYFLPYFIGPFIRMFFYLIITFALIIAKVLPYTSWGRRINTVFNEPSTEELDRLAKRFSMCLIIGVYVTVAFVLDSWASYVIYKCSKYVLITPLQNKYNLHKNPKVTEKTTKRNLQKSKSSMFDKIEKYIPRVFIIEFWIFSVISNSYQWITAKLFQREWKQHPIAAGKRRTDNLQEPSAAIFDTIKEYTVELSFTRFFQKRTPSKTVVLQPKTKAASFETTEAEMVFLEPEESKTTKSNDDEVVKNATENCNIEIVFFNQVQNQQNIIEKLEPLEVLEKDIKQQSLDKWVPSKAIKSSHTMDDASFAPLFLRAQNFNEKKQFVNAEIQSEESSFDQRIAEKQWQNNGHDSDGPLVNTPMQPHDYDQKSIIASSSGFASTSDSPFQTSSPIPESQTTVTFIFNNDETCAIEICQNGRKEKLKNSFGNEWTPLYFSMARSTFEIGEIAQKDLHNFPEFVVYDIFKVIGKFMHEIQINPEWKFEVVEENRIKAFQIQTQNGLRLFPEHIIVGAFLKTLKSRAQSYLNIEINEICICTNFKLTEFQKNVFKNAASRLHLKVLSFDVT